MSFTSIPSRFYASNNKSSLLYPQFVSQGMPKLLENNCVEELKQKPYYCNSLTVTEGNPVDTGHKLNVHKTFRRRPGRLLNVLCTLNLRPVSTGKKLRLVLDLRHVNKHIKQ